MRKDMRDKNVYNCGYRITMLRKEKGLTQKDFAETFTEFCGLTKPITVSAVSSWEQDRRLPNTKFLLQLSLFFGVSIDYLFGLTDQRNATGNDEKQSKVGDFLRAAELPIKNSNLPQYNGMPVYVKFKNNSHLSQWGILNLNKKKVICKDFAVLLAPEVECYPYAPLKPIRTQIYSLQQMMNTEYIWVESTAEDPLVGAKIDGRYTHEPNKKFLIRLGDNLPLSYAGLDLTYRAFRA